MMMDQDPLNISDRCIVQFRALAKRNQLNDEELMVQLLNLFIQREEEMKDKPQGIQLEFF